MPSLSMNRLFLKYALLVGFSLEQSTWIANLVAQENFQQSASALKADSVDSVEGKSAAPKVIDRSTFSDSQWERLVNATVTALDANVSSPGQGVTSKLLLNDPGRRSQAFEAFVDELLSSDSYSQWRAQTWINDMMSKPAIDRGEYLGWSIESYRRWLIESARRNDRFDAFLRMQCHGHEQLRSDQRMLPTAVWYFAGHRSAFDVIELPTPIESNLLRPFRESLESIVQAEERDWQRLNKGTEASGGAVEKWYRGELDYPKVPEEILAWQWPNAQGLDEQARVTNGDSSIEHMGQPLRANRDWTLVFQLDVSAEALASDLPIVIFEQQEISQETKPPPELQRESQHEQIQEQMHDITDRAGRTLRLELVRGHLQLSLVHDQDVSELVLRTKQAIYNGTLQIAVVNEGLGGPGSVRLVVDGKPLDLAVDDAVDEAVGEAVASSGASRMRLWKEIVRSEKVHWRLTQRSVAGIECQDAKVFRLGLSIPELRGLTESFFKSDWESLEEEEKGLWVEHYAKRFDSQWRYQRESRAYYAGNLKSIQESEAMVPVLAGANVLVEVGSRDVFPARLLNAFDELFKSNMQSTPQNNPESSQESRIGGNLEGRLVLTVEEWIERLGIADAEEKTEDQVPEKLADLEVLRTWKNLCNGYNRTKLSTGDTKPSTVDRNGLQPNAAATFESVRTEFVRTADQMNLVKQLLLSDAWVMHVLDELAQAN
ncbi:MAG: hypothetical protein RL240_2781 [Planctomycetota bacterium]